jgi:hypothetical protein
MGSKLENKGSRRRKFDLEIRRLESKYSYGVTVVNVYQIRSTVCTRVDTLNEQRLRLVPSSKLKSCIVLIDFSPGIQYLFEILHNVMMLSSSPQIEDDKSKHVTCKNKPKFLTAHRTFRPWTIGRNRLRDVR